MMGISTEIMAREQTINALTEYYEPDGRKLENGMVVLLADTSYKYDPDSFAVPKDILVTNRWCRVTNFKDLSSDLNYAKIVSFIGVYGDGKTEKRLYHHEVGWYVKRDSVPKPDDKKAEVLDLVLEIMDVNRDSYIFGGKIEIADEYAGKIIKLFKE